MGDVTRRVESMWYRGCVTNSGDNAEAHDRGFSIPLDSVTSQSVPDDRGHPVERPKRT